MSQYTDKQKIAYYKKLALGAPAPTRRAATYTVKKAPARRAQAKTVVSRPKSKALKGYGAYSSEKKEKKEKGGIGERIGSTLGAGIGKGVHMLVKHLTGFGDYNVEYNSLMEGGLSPPEIVNSSKEGGIIVRHREYLGDINATTAFTLQAYQLNPGLVDSFPWLSTVASAFEQYKWRGVVFEYISLSSDAILSASTSSALGAVIMATEYNSLNDNFPNKAAMENHEFANSRKPSLNFMHPVECKKSLTSVDLLYVRAGDIPANADIRLYDLGKTEIATVGMQATSGVAGELWVTYEVELYKPQLASGVVPDNQLPKTDHFTIGTVALPGNTPFGSVTPLSPSYTNNLGGVITSSGTQGTYTFPPAAVGETFQIMYICAGGSVTIADPAVSIYGGTLVQMYKNNTVTSVQPDSGSIGGLYVYIATVKPTTSTCSIKIDGGGFALLPSAALCDFYVNSMPGNVAEEEDSETSVEEVPPVPVISDEVRKYLELKGIKL